MLIAGGLLGGDGDFGGEPKPQDHQGLGAISLDDQQIAVDEPGVNLCEAVRSCFHFDATIDTEDRDGEIGARHVQAANFLCGETALLEKAHDGSFSPTALVATPATAHEATSTMGTSSP
jgi:hypothetical protein